MHQLRDSPFGSIYDQENECNGVATKNYFWVNRNKQNIALPQEAQDALSLEFPPDLTREIIKRNPKCCQYNSILNRWGPVTKEFSKDDYVVWINQKNTKNFAKVKSFLKLKWITPENEKKKMVLAHVTWIEEKKSEGLMSLATALNYLSHEIDLWKIYQETKDIYIPAHQIQSTVLFEHNCKQGICKIEREKIKHYEDNELVLNVTQMGV